LSHDNNKPNHYHKYSAKAIRKAIQALTPMLGHASIDEMIDDLEMQGLNLTDDNEKYRLEQVEIALDKIFGPETTLLIMSHIIQKLKA
jgi:hypothetical protein